MTERDWTAEEVRKMRTAAAEYVRAIYVQERRLHVLQTTNKSSDFGRRRIPRYDGGVDAEGRRHKMIWGRIFDFCVLNGFPLEAYIRAQFVAGERTPLPNQLQSRTAQRRYHEHRSVVVGDMRRRLEDEKRRFKVSVSHYRRIHSLDMDVAARHVLKTDKAVSPLFRYVMANLAADHEIMALLEPAAVLQFLTAQHDYEKAWQGFLPTDLIDKATALLNTAGTRKGTQDGV